MRFYRHGDVHFLTSQKDISARNRVKQPKLGKAKKHSYLKFFGRHEHRVVMEKKLGRALVRGEIVHHIDGNRHNNKPENLQLMTQSEHWNVHRDEIISAIKNKPKKNKCPSGHEYNEQNSGFNKKGIRFCRVCARLANRAWSENAKNKRLSTKSN